MGSSRRPGGLEEVGGGGAAGQELEQGAEDTPGGADNKLGTSRAEM